MAGRTASAVPEGKYTSTVYEFIKEHKYGEAIKILTIELQTFPRSRAALSLLGHCYYMLQDYPNAVAMYEMLAKFYSGVEEYKMYYAQSLYKAGMYVEAMRAATACSPALSFEEWLAKRGTPFQSEERTADLGAQMARVPPQVPQLPDGCLIQSAAVDVVDGC